MTRLIASAGGARFGRFAAKANDPGGAESRERGNHQERDRP